MQILLQVLITFVVFAASVALGAIAGGWIGGLIADQNPGYYRSVFPTAATQPGFEPAEMGRAIGIGQGAAAGLVVGAVIVLALAIAQGRRKAPTP